VKTKKLYFSFKRRSFISEYVAYYLNESIKKSKAIELGEGAEFLDTVKPVLSGSHINRTPFIKGTPA